MEFQSLAESPLGVTDEELAALFTPFVRDTVSGDNPEWRGEIARRKKKVCVNTLSRGFSAGCLRISATKRRSSPSIPGPGRTVSMRPIRWRGRRPVSAPGCGAASEHANTDIMVISYLARKLGNIFTTKPSVHERAGVHLLATAVEG